MSEVKLTQYSHGAGCGCKISPKILDTILKSENKAVFPNLLVGNNTKDDAAVFAFDENYGIVSTTDFFMPIVDDPYDFGRIASANAISDIYAMGGTPMMAIAILGWPIDKLAPEIAQKVLEGSRSICAEANIPLAGGHSIDCPEPIFGLAVTGKIKTNAIKRNATATVGDHLFLTKPLGVGILTTAQKKGKLTEAHNFIARDYMIALNRIGEKLGEMPMVTAMTDVTGFGLLGHLIEICEGSNLTASLAADKVPVIPEAMEYFDKNCFPGGTKRNWDSYGHKVEGATESHINILCDPQTSGGLLISVKEASSGQFVDFMKSNGFDIKSFGTIVEKQSMSITIRS